MKSIVRILVILVFSSPVISWANQPDTHPFNSAIGLTVGYGTQDFGLLHLGVQYYYKVIIHQIHYSVPILKYEKLRTDALIGIQYNITEYYKSFDCTVPLYSHEHGFNIGSITSYQVGNNIKNVYVLVSLAGLFINNAPDRQSNGFIFSDNIGIGITIHMINNIDISPQFGFRHISNAGIKSPNGGIHNWVISIGCIYNL